MELVMLYYTGRRHFHLSHNAPSFPKKILHKQCFQFLLGRLYDPGEMKNRGYAKFERERGGWVLVGGE